MKNRLLYLLRHGETETNGQKLLVGQTDLPLSQKGILPAKQLMMEFSGLRCGAFTAATLNGRRQLLKR